MSEQDATQASPLQRPPNDDTEAWKAYWKTQGQPWRTEPEIDAERQKYLAERRRIAPAFIQGMYPFKDIQLSRADIEWLLATHESSGMRGPVDWNDESQREREGLDLRGADLHFVDLHGLPLAGLLGGELPSHQWDDEKREQRYIAGVHLEEANLYEASLEAANLTFAHLEGANLYRSNLKGADLRYAQLARARLYKTHLEGANLYRAHLEDADLLEAHLEGADLTRAFLSSATRLREVMLSNEQHGCVSLAGVHWNNVDLSVVDWHPIRILGDEQVARQEKDSQGKTKDKETRLDELKEAVRANRQLAIVLREQGLNEVADRFAYRAQKLQRVVWRRERRFLQYAFSWFLAVVAGYGYKPYRCFVVYFLAVIGFTLAHYIVGDVAGPPLTFLNALAVSVQSLHGRLFSFQASDPQTLLNTIEAFVGLFIEAIVVAVITQRILGR